MGQGCPLSPCLFILATEILACKIWQNKEIQGIKIFGKELKLSHFADDTTLLNSNCNSINIGKFWRHFRPEIEPFED